MRWREFALFAVLVFFAVNIPAASYLGSPEYYVQKNYSSNESIVGWINISFQNESYNEKFNDVFGNHINLSQVLSANPLYNYTINTTSNTISSGFGKLDLSNSSFRVSSTSGKYNYRLFIGEYELLNEEIDIDSQKADIKKRVDEKLQVISELKKDILKFDSILQERINSVIMINNSETELNLIKNQIDSYSFEEYAELEVNISKMNIPDSIIIGVDAKNVPFISEERIINPEIISKISGESYNPNMDDAYVSSILFWEYENLKPHVSFKEINGNYDGLEKHMFSYFEFTFGIEPSSETYFIVEKSDGLQFRQNYGEKEEDNYYYFDLSGNENRIIFTTTENFNFLNVPVIISPPLSKLSLAEIPEYTESESIKVSKWLLFTLIIVLVFILSAIVYSILHTWYDKRYENYLFKDRNNLYNLITYVNNAKSRGMKDEEIVRNLKKSKWKGEQINYVMKKYSGKRTGMSKIPLLGMFVRVKNTQKFNKPNPQK